MTDIVVGVFFGYAIVGVLFFPSLAASRPAKVCTWREAFGVVVRWPYLAMKLAYVKYNETK